MLRKNLILLSCCVCGLLILYAWIRHQDSDLEFSRSQYAGRFRTPILRIRLNRNSNQQLFSQQTTTNSALLIHGISASKSTMTQLGTELARWGLDCYLMDLPGHGESPERFSRSSAQQAVDEIVQALLSSRSAPPRLYVIGHSLGAGLAIEAGKREQSVSSVVAISPMAEPITPKSPTNLLILLGEFDFPFVRRGAAYLYEEGTGTRTSPLDYPGEWENLSHTRRVVVLPWTDHSQIIFRPRTLLEIKNWFKQKDSTTENSSSHDTSFSWHLLLRILFCLGVLFCWIPAFSLLVEGLIRLFPKKSERAMEGTGPDISLESCHRHIPNGNNPHLFVRYCRLSLWVYVLACNLASLFLLWINPWSRLNLMAGDYLCGFFFITGLLACLLGIPLSEAFRFRWRESLCSFLGILVLFLTATPVMNRNFVNLTIIPTRLWRFPLIAISVLPFYLYDEWVCRSYTRLMGWSKLILFHLSTRLILILALLIGFFVLQNGQFLVALILPGLLISSILCWCLAAWVYHKTRSASASALFSALATAWFFSAFFSQV